MKFRLLPLIGATAAGLIAAGLVGNNAATGEAVRPPFRVVFVDELESKTLRSFIRSRTTRSGIAALQAELNGDATLSRKLRARGIAIRNIISRDVTPDGRPTFYVR